MTEYIDPIFGTRKTQEQMDTDRQIREYGESLISAGEQAAEQREQQQEQADFESFVRERVEAWTKTGGTPEGFKQVYSEDSLRAEFLSSREDREQAAHERRVSGHTSVF